MGKVTNLETQNLVQLFRVWVKKYTEQSS